MEDLDVGNDFAPDDWDDDDQGDADVQQPRRRKNYLTLWEKKDIVEEAYAAPRRVKATARKYGVQPKQIRRWRINANALTGLPHYPEPRTVEERGVIKKAKENVTLHKGRSSKLSPEHQDHIIEYYEQLRERGIPVSSQTLAIELLRVAPEFNDVDVSVIRRRVLRVMKNVYVTHRSITHKAQNIRYQQPVINDFVTYVQRQIVAGKYDADLILNVDETNIDFDETSGKTLAGIGTRSVSGKINGHSGRATVVLCCAMSGEKLPAFVIWKGVANGRIARECRGPQYPHNNIKYAVQPKGWLDSATYKQWVREVVLPYTDGRDAYLIQDSFSVHAKEENVIVLQHGGVEVEFIPAGYTAVLQVLDKGVHRSFKHFYRENCINWLTQQQLPNAKPTRILVARWIRDAWERVTAVSIVNTWNSIPLHPFEPE
jgi:transposase-like protein